MLLDDIISRGRRFKGMISKLDGSDKLLELMNVDSIRTVDTIKTLEDTLSNVNIDMYIYITRVYSITFYDIKKDIESILGELDNLIPNTVLKNDLDFTKLNPAEYRLYEIVLMLSLVNLMEQDIK